jgi:hypothetical protein
MYALGGGHLGLHRPRSAESPTVHRPADRVMVVDENSGTLLGEVSGIDGAHGTAFVAA